MAAAIMPAHAEEPLLSNPLTSLRARWRAQPRARRESLSLGFALAFGLLLLPWYLARGQSVLGPYARGGAPSASSATSSSVCPGLARVLGGRARARGLSLVAAFVLVRRADHALSQAIACGL